MTPARRATEGYKMTTEEETQTSGNGSGSRAVTMKTSLNHKHPQQVECHGMARLQPVTVRAPKKGRRRRRPRVKTVVKGRRRGEIEDCGKFPSDLLCQRACGNKMAKSLDSIRAEGAVFVGRSKPSNAHSQGESTKKEFIPSLTLRRKGGTSP